MTWSTGSWFRFAIFALIVASCAQPLFAQPPTEAEVAKAEAKAKFEAGTKAFDEGRYKDAVVLYLQADALFPDPAFAYNAASAYDRMGDSENALRWSREYLRRSPEAPDRGEVEERIRRYEGALEAKGVQQVTILSSPSGATLELDGAAVGVTPWTGEIPPGPHTARLRLPGHREMEQPFTLAADRALEVTATLELAPAAPKATPPPPRIVIEEADTPIMLPIGIIAASIGVAAAGVGIGLEAARAGALSDARDAADQLVADARYGEAETFMWGARVLVGAGAALALVGGVLIAVDLGTADDEQEASLGLACGAAHCRLTFTGTIW